MYTPDVAGDEGEQEAQVLHSGVQVRAPDDAGRAQTVYLTPEFVQALAEAVEAEQEGGA